MHQARALSSKVNNNRANGHTVVVTLRGFNYLGCLVNPIFLSMGCFLYRFSMFCEKNEENLSSGSLNFLQNASLNSVHLTS